MLFKWYLCTYFASFTGYEDDIFEVISKLHLQGSKFGGKFEKFGNFFFFNLTSQSSWSLFFPSLDSEPVKRTARAAGA